MTAPAPGREFSYAIEIARLPTAGGQYDIVASAEALARVAARLDVTEMKALRASFAVGTGAGGIVHVKGKVHAELVQACVVSLAPVPAVIDEDVDVSFITPERAERNAKKAKATPEDEEVIGLEAEDPPEVAQDGRIDLGELAVTQLALVLDPYPRAPGVSFDPAQWPASPGRKGSQKGSQAPEAEPEAGKGPFAALAKLKENRQN
jgi:uncharacterized metal-binding protein YceD (DUF177 family)